MTKFLICYDITETDLLESKTEEAIFRDIRKTVKQLLLKRHAGVEINRTVWIADFTNTDGTTPIADKIKQYILGHLNQNFPNELVNQHVRLFVHIISNLKKHVSWKSPICDDNNPGYLKKYLNLK